MQQTSPTNPMPNFELGGMQVHLDLEEGSACITHTPTSTYKRQWMIFSLPFALFLFMLLFYGISQIVAGELRMKMLLAMMVALPALAGIVYYNAVLHYSIRKVFFEKDRVIARQKPLFWFGNFGIRFGQLDGFYVVERFPARKMNGSKEELGLVGLYALSQKGRRLTIVEGDKDDLSVERMVALYAAIKKHMGYPYRLKYLKEHPIES